MKTKTLKIILAALTVVSLALAIYCLVVSIKGTGNIWALPAALGLTALGNFINIILFEEVQREGGIRWPLSLMNQRCIPAISVGSSSRWKRCTNFLEDIKEAYRVFEGRAEGIIKIAVGI